MGIECIKMHIDRANEVTMTVKAAGPACPISSLGLMFMPTYRTPATCSSFRASEAHDVSGFRFVCEVVDILAIFPQGHTLIVMPTVISIAHPMRVANEERTDFVFDTEVDHLLGRLMPQITDTTLSTAALLVLGTLQLLPSTRILLATSLLLGDFAKLLIALPFEGTDSTSGDNERPGGRGGDSSQVDFAKVYGCLNLTS
jgi:hypothetical protein